jgi:serine/threonine protein kinase
MLLNKGHAKPVDCWALGISTYEMIAGIDPFNDDDPMAISQKILKVKIKFLQNFDKGAKSLVKHLLETDVTKGMGVFSRTNPMILKNTDGSKLGMVHAVSKENPRFIFASNREAR